MLLRELFDNDFDIGQDAGDLVNRLRQTMIDILTPLAAQGVPFVTVDSVIDQLRKMRSGIDVDRGLVMQVLDPTQVKMINKIEGDRIFFSTPTENTNKSGPDQAEKDKNKVSQTAAKQAQKSVTT